MRLALAVALALVAPPAPNHVHAGIACRVAGANCGRVGVAVWLPRPADRVRASLLGRRVVLATNHSGSGRYGFRRYWTGFVRLVPARVRPGTAIRVRVTVARGGETRTATDRTRLSAGWG